jgi:hypothetical protein
LGAPTGGFPEPSALWQGTQVSKTSLPRVAASVLPKPHPERFSPPINKRREAQVASRYAATVCILLMFNRKGIPKARILAADKIENKRNLLQERM